MNVPLLLYLSVSLIYILLIAVRFELKIRKQDLNKLILMDFYALSTLVMTSMILQGNDLQIFLKLFSEEPESTEMEGTKETTEGNISIMST